MLSFKNRSFIKCGLTLAFATALTAPASARDYISIVGSSTVYPFATVVAENFGKTTKFKTPKIESTGTGGGFKLFCAGVGVQHPDISNASRAIKTSELESCKKNGVTDIVEVKIGYDGIAVANSKWSPQLQITVKELYMALAKEIPDPSGAQQTVANPHKTWRHINPKFLNTRIEVLGPPPTSGTRDAFTELVMEAGCKQFGWIHDLEKANNKEFKRLCHTVREDGGYIEAGENDNLIVQKLIANPKTFGIFGFSFLDQNTDKLQGSAINGVAPEFETIANGSYPVSRPLFIYVKKAHVGTIPGIQEYLAEFTSDKSWGKNGYLADRGLIPMPDGERKQYTSKARNLEAMK